MILRVSKAVMFTDNFHNLLEIPISIPIMMTVEITCNDTPSSVATASLPISIEFPLPFESQVGANLICQLMMKCL